MILNDYRCLAHGAFESASGACPHGCNARMVQKVFIQPPAYHNGTTKRTDGHLKGLADEFRMTDFNNQNATGPAHVTDWRQNALTGQTVAVPFQEGASAIGATMGALGVQGGNALKDMSIPQPKVQTVASYQPKP